MMTALLFPKKPYNTSLYGHACGTLSKDERITLARMAASLETPLGATVTKTVTELHCVLLLQGLCGGKLDDALCIPAHVSQWLPRVLRAASAQPPVILNDSTGTRFQPVLWLSCHLLSFLRPRSQKLTSKTCHATS